MDEELLRSWDIIPGTSFQQTKKQKAPIPPAANVAPKVAAKKDMAASGASASSQNSQGPRMPFLHKHIKKRSPGEQEDDATDECAKSVEHVREQHHTSIVHCIHVAAALFSESKRVRQGPPPSSRG